MDDKKDDCGWCPDDEGLLASLLKKGKVREKK